MRRFPKSPIHLSHVSTLFILTICLNWNSMKLLVALYGNLRGCLHDTGATFAPERVHYCSLSWLYICLHDTTTKYNVMPARVTPAWVHPGCCTGARISLRYEISQRYHVKAKRPHVSVWNGSVGRLEREAHALCLRFWITLVFYQHEVYLQIARYEMMKWPSHNVNAIRNQKVIPVWNSRGCEFSRANTPLPSDARIQSATIRGLGLTLEKKPALRRLSREVRVFRREDCLLAELG